MASFNNRIVANYCMRRLYNNIKNHSNWLFYYIFKYLNSGGAGFTFKTRGGLKINVQKRLLHTYKECFFDETYTKGLPKGLLKSMNENKSINMVDVGANVGYFSLYFLSQFNSTNVYAYEPMPMNFNLLKQYRDDIANLNLTAINQAVGGKSETILLNYNANQAFTTSASIFEHQLAGDNDQLEVQCTTLEDLIQSNNINQIDFLKLDCEGSEYPILYGASQETLNRISIFSIETHLGKKDNENINSLAAYLRKYDFEIQMDGDIMWGWKKILTLN